MSALADTAKFAGKISKAKGKGLFSRGLKGVPGRVRRFVGKKINKAAVKQVKETISSPDSGLLLHEIRKRVDTATALGVPRNKIRRMVRQGAFKGSKQTVTDNLKEGAKIYGTAAGYVGGVAALSAASRRKKKRKGGKK